MRALSLSLLVLAACHSTPTETVVQIVDEDLAVPDEVDALAITVRQMGTIVWSQAQTPFCLAGQAPSQSPPDCLTLPVVFSLYPGPKSGDEAVDIEVVTTRSGATIIDDAATFTFAHGKRQLLSFTLRRDCLGSDCAHLSQNACGAGGVCESLAPVPLTSDPPLDGGPPDVAVPRDLGGGGDTDLAEPCNTPCNFDGVQDHCETGIDCGGGGCGLCIDTPCTADDECASGVCPPQTGQRSCSYASGPPFWIGATNLSSKRHSFATAVSNGRIWVMGGSQDTAPLDTAESWAPGESTWTDAGQLPNALVEVAAAGRSGKIDLVGGRDNMGAYHGELYEGVPSGTTIAWGNAISPGLTSPRSGHSAILDKTSTLWVIGGQDTSSFFSSVEERADGASAWTAGPSLIAPEWSGAAAFIADSTASGTVYLLGGSAGSSQDSLSACTSVGGWQALADMPLARDSLGAAAGADGRIYAVGGSTGSTLRETVVAYSPQTDSWALVAPLSDPRRMLRVVQGPDGRLYAMGGCGSADCLTDVKTDVDAYGPVLTLGAATLGPGASFTVAGMNFASSATVRVLIDDQLAAVATTSSAGVLANTTLVAPAAAGTHTIIAVDEKSGYPARLSITY